jgi:excisionase family DNA binding protein
VKSERTAVQGSPVTSRAPATIPRQPEAAHARLLLTVEEAAATIGVGRSLMYELIATGDIQTVRVGRLRRISPDAPREYIAQLSS